MCFFKKKKLSKAVEDSRNTIAENVRQIDKLMAIFDNNIEILEKLSELKRQVSYLSPKADKETTAYDKKIGNALSDIELHARKAEKKEDYSDIENLIKSVKILISKR